MPNHWYDALKSVSGRSVMDFFSSTIATFFVFLSVSRSSDYGSTYTKLNDKVGRTLLSYLYVCPTNKQKVSISLLLLSFRLISYKLHIKWHFFFFCIKLLPNDGVSVSPPLLMPYPSPCCLYFR